MIGLILQIFIALIAYGIWRLAFLLSNGETPWITTLDNIVLATVLTIVACAAIIDVIDLVITIYKNRLYKDEMKNSLEEAFENATRDTGHSNTDSDISYPSNKTLEENPK